MCTVSMVKECEGDGNTSVGAGGPVITVNVWHECVCGTRGSTIVSSAADIIWMSVVRGMGGVRGVCEMCMCLARGGVGGEG